MRGMGDLFGERQSGVPTFRIADPLRDEELNDRARAAAAALLARDAGLERAGARRTCAACSANDTRDRWSSFASAERASARLAAVVGGCARRFRMRSSSALAFASSSFKRLISASAD